MTAKSVLRFGEGFVLEPAAFQHKSQADEWTAADSDHAGRVDPRFWLEQAPDRDSYLVSDLRGPVLFFTLILLLPGPERIRKVAELHMQFMPTTTQLDHERIRAALMAGCPWLERILEGAGVEEITFDSRSDRLIAFCVKRLGFLLEDNGVPRKRLVVPAATGR